MKLSAIRGERTLDVIADIIEPMGRIAEDKEFAELTKRRRVPKGMTAEQFFIGRLTKALPGLIRNHKADIIVILAAVSDTTPEEYEEGLTIPGLIRDVTDLMTDEDFMTFLGLQGAETEGAPSGEPSGSTEGPSDPEPSSGTASRGARRKSRS